MYNKFRISILNSVSAVFSLALVGWVLGGSQPASAQTSTINGPTQTGEICMQKVFGTPVTNANRLNCTANDIRLSRAISVDPATCTAGATFTLTATFETIVTANIRYDAAFFFRLDGGPNARGDGTNAAGQCSLSALDPTILPGEELDGDTCGDLRSGTYNLTFEIPGVLCVDTDGDGFLNLPNCTSWHSNQGTACNINTAFDFQPDTKSKCVCDDTFQVPVAVEQAEITVVKTAAPISVPETGGTVTYTVQVTNDSQFESVTITDITDNLYGNLGTNTPPQTNNTCPSLIGVELGPQGSGTESASCSFDVLVTGDFGQTVTDVAEVCGDQSGNVEDPRVCDDDDANVTITDVAATPAVTKNAQSAACTVDVTYQVVVTNNSAIDTLTVNTLTDDQFGDITTAHAADGFKEVVSTNCATGGTIAKSGNYPCSFVGRINSETCNFTHTNTVTANVTDDDEVTSEPSDMAVVTVSTTFN